MPDLGRYITKYWHGVLPFPSYIVGTDIEFAFTILLSIAEWSILPSTGLLVNYLLISKRFWWTGGLLVFRHALRMYDIMNSKAIVLILLADPSFKSSLDFIMA